MLQGKKIEPHIEQLMYDNVRMYVYMYDYVCMIMYVHHYEKYYTQFPTAMVMYFYSNLSVTVYIWKCAENDQI